MRIKCVGGCEISLIHLSYQSEFYRLSWHRAAGDNWRMALQRTSMPVRKHSCIMHQWQDENEGVNWITWTHVIITTLKMSKK